LIGAAQTSLAQTISGTRQKLSLDEPLHPRSDAGCGRGQDSGGSDLQDLVQPNLDKALASGWQTVTYRQNTELAVEAWHWKPTGTWSDPSGKGYFTRSSLLPNPFDIPMAMAYRAGGLLEMMGQEMQATHG
jgi:hypothetical protein